MTTIMVCVMKMKEMRSGGGGGGAAAADGDTMGE
jgi:hypothetical protein